MNSWNSKAADKDSVYGAFAEVVKALGNGRRLELLELMAQGEHSVETLARMSGMGVTTVSAHLQTLKRVGLVKTRRERTTIYYRIAGDDVAELYTAAKRVALSRHSRMRDVLGTYLGRPRARGPVIDRTDVDSTMFVVDVRPREEYDAGHLPASVSIPMAELGERHTEIPAGAHVVVYCRGELCRMAREAAGWLRSRGVDARAMDEGIVEWRAAKGVDLESA